MTETSTSTAGAPNTAARKIAVVGSGYMGGGIAQVLALGGARVALADVSAEVAQKNFDRLLEESDQFIKDGLFPEGSTEILKQNLWAAKDIEEAVADADFIEEAVPEVLEIKHQTLARISAAAKPDALIGSNTSTISIAALAEAVTNPERFLGVHFSNPSPFIPGVEVIPHAGTSAATVSASQEMVHAAGKQTAVVKDVTGFVLNRLQYALFHEAAQLVEQGIATADDVDTLVRTTFGFRLPFFGRSPSPTWPGWMSTTSATSRCRPASRNASQRRRSSPTSWKPASSAPRPAQVSSTFPPSAPRNSSRTATRLTWPCKSSLKSLARHPSTDSTKEKSHDFPR